MMPTRPLFAGALFLVMSLGPTQAVRAEESILSNLGLLEQLTRSAVDEIVGQLELDASKPVLVVARTGHEGNAFVQDRLAQTLSARGYRVAVAEAPMLPDSTAGAGASVKSAPPPAGSGTSPAAPPGPAAPAASDTTGQAAPASSEDSVPGASPGEAGTGGAPADEEAAMPGSDGADGVAARDEVAFGFGVGVTVPGAGGEAVSPVLLDLEILEFGVRYAEVGRKYFLGPVQFTRIAGVYLKVRQHEAETGYVRGLVTAERHHWDRVSGRERLLAEGSGYPFARPELSAPGLGTYLEPALVVGIVGGLVYLFYENQN